MRRNGAYLLALGILLGGGSWASATGYWNVPSTTCQWLGCGFGGGYHAPLLLGPVTYECLYPPNEVRLRYAPNPYACTPYHGGCSHGFRADEAGGPTMMAPAPASEPLPQPVGAPAARRPMFFAPPVQR